MNQFAVILTMLLGLNAHAEAIKTKTITITGIEARNVMEAAAANGYKVIGIDQEWAEVNTLYLETGPINCYYSNASYPDQWMTGVECFEVAASDMFPLKESFALAKAIKNYSTEDGATSHQAFSVMNISCTLKYNEKSYSCDIETQSLE